MATSAERAARERKQKLFVAVGGVALLLLVGIQLPGYLGGSSSSATGTTATEAAVGSPGTTETAVGSPGTTETPQPRPTPIAASLPDTDRPLAAAPGKLRSFSSFASKDPFVQQVDTSATGAAPAAGGSGTPSKATAKPAEATQPPTKGFSVGDGPSAAVTVIAVNGRRQALEPGALFPAPDRAFVLVDERPGAKVVVIGVAGGSFASGSATLTLKLGKPLVLENTTTGARYRLVLVAIGDGKAAGPAETEPTRVSP